MESLIVSRERRAKSLLRALRSARRIAVVGVAKNCGKTTTLNRLLATAASMNRVCGVVSVGIDGEASDALIGTPKPPVHVTRDQWVVSAEAALATATAQIEYVASLGYRTPLGEVILGRVLTDGDTVLAGIRHRQDLERAVDILGEHGVDLSFVDGAYGRVVGAHPALADAVVVSTGAVVSPQIEGIVAKTADLVQRLSLSEIEASWARELIERAIAEDRALLGGPRTTPRALPRKSALLGLAESRALWTEEIRAVAVPGLVSDRVVEELLRIEGARELLIPDPTVLQAQPGVLRRLARSWTLRAARRAPVVAISINPSSVQGHAVEREPLIAALGARWPKLSVFDPLLGVQ